MSALDTMNEVKKVVNTIFYGSWCNVAERGSLKCPENVRSELQGHWLGCCLKTLEQVLTFASVKLQYSLWLINKFALNLCSKPYQPFQSPGYRSPEGQVWNRLLHNDCADQRDSVSS